MLAHRISPGLMAPLVRYGNALEHVVDAEIRRRLGPPSVPMPTGRMPFEVVAEVEGLSRGAAVLMFGPEQSRALDEQACVAVVEAPLDAPQHVELRARGREICEPLTLQQAMLVLHYARRFGAGARAIAELVHGAWSWARWTPSYNQLIGTHLLRRSARLTAIARGENVTMGDL